MRTPSRIPRTLVASAVTMLTASSCRWGYGLVLPEDPPATTLSDGGSGGAADSGTGGGDGATGGNAGAHGGEGGAPGTGGAGDWWEPAFASRSRILLNNGDLTEALTDFPVAIFLDTSTIDYRQAGPEGESLRFVDSDDDTRLWH